jgi:hypothetical protein
LVGRAQLKWTQDELEESLPEVQFAKGPPPKAPRTPVFTPSDDDFGHWERQNRVWSVAIAVTAGGAPIAFGAVSGHVVAGLTVGALGLFAVGVLAFGFWVLDNTLPL